MSKMYERYLNEKRQWLEIVKQAETADSGGGRGRTETAFQITSLPEPVQRYLKMAGFADRPLPKAGEVVWKESRIKFGPDKPWTSLKTLQFNATPSPVRMAYMTTKMFGVLPFEGRDLFADGHGHMLGKIAGLIPVFDDLSREISQSGVVTVLAEAFLVPGYLTEPYVTWEAIDERTAKARLTAHSLTGEGIFTFNDLGEMTTFVSHDRYFANPKGGNERQTWTAYCDNYIEKDGVRFPSVVRAAWNLPEGEFEYWNGTIDRVIYDIVE